MHDIWIAATHTSAGLSLSARSISKLLLFLLSLFLPMVAALVLYNVATAVAIAIVVAFSLTLFFVSCWPLRGQPADALNELLCSEGDFYL